MSEKRKEQRRFTNAMFAVTWEDARGQSRAIRARGLNVSKSGMRIESSEEMHAGVPVSLQAERHELAGKATVRNCTRRGSAYLVGLEFSEETKRTLRLPLVDAVDFYEVLQVSPNAEAETIHRVYRIMAARFHPDNPQTGDSERFLLLNDAYEVLSDAEKRALYDAARRVGECQPLPRAEPPAGYLVPAIQPAPVRHGASRSFATGSGTADVVSARVYCFRRLVPERQRLRADGGQLGLRAHRDGRGPRGNQLSPERRVSQIAQGLKSRPLYRFRLNPILFT
jgi:DnaJ-domain-containing protein 1